MAEKQLLFSVTKNDFSINWFSGTGAGGQHRNKHQNCCRLTHIETGIMKTGQSNRTREQNLREAFLSITKDKSFNIWLRTKSAEALGLFSDIDEKVDKEMKKVMVEVKDEFDNWIPE